MAKQKTGEVKAHQNGHGGMPDEEKELGKYFLAAPPDHDGHAECILRWFPGQFRHNLSHGWLVWTNTHWSETEAGSYVTRATLATLNKRRELAGKAEASELYRRSWANYNTVRGVMGLLADKKQVTTPIAEFNSLDHLLNCANGVVNLKTGEVTPHDPQQLFTYCLATAYDPNADQGPWLEFLNQVTEGPEIVDYLRLAVGYSMTGETREEIMFYLYGPPRAGKGTFTETLLAMLGMPLGRGVNFRMFTADRSGDTSMFDFAELVGTRFIAASESNRYKPMNEEIVKSITGNDPLHVAKKHRPHFQLIWKAKVWLTSNWPVNADVDDQAVWTRLRVIRFPHSFVGKEDKLLKAKLRSAEGLQGVLAWAVQGAMDWYALDEHGLKTPDVVAAEVARQRAQLDTIGQFLSENCVIDLETKTEKGRLATAEVGSKVYQAYATWCDEQEHEAKRTRKQFTVSLSTRGIEVEPRLIGGKTERVYAGLRFKTERERQGEQKAQPQVVITLPELPAPPEPEIDPSLEAAWMK